MSCKTLSLTCDMLHVYVHHCPTVYLKTAVSSYAVLFYERIFLQCRRVAGSRMTAMYHLCYDDGPHWATELMQLCFMFEIFSKVNWIDRHFTAAEYISHHEE